MNPLDQTAINYLKSANFKDTFKRDLFLKLDKMSNGFEKNIFLYQLVDLASSYALEMCVEFKEKADHITTAIIEYLCDEVCAALEDLISEFSGNRDEVKRRVKLSF